MRNTITCALTACMAFTTVPALAQVDYHKAQQAGKAWERKQGSNRARASADRRPATRTEMDRARARHRSEYDRLIRSVGTKNADLWLGFKARQMRRTR